MFMLPQEIQDKIFLYLNFVDLENTREFQSMHVKQITKYNNYIDAILNRNLENIQWLYYNHYEIDIDIFSMIDMYDQMDINIQDWLKLLKLKIYICKYI